LSPPIGFDHGIEAHPLRKVDKKESSVVDVIPPTRLLQFIELAQL